MSLVALMLAVAVGNAPPGPPSPIIRKPVYERFPTFEETWAAYPEQAMKDRIGLYGYAECEVAKDGWLGRCVLLYEDPVASGLETSLEALRPLMKLSPTDGDGVAVKGRKVRFPVQYALPMINSPYDLRFAEVEECAAFAMAEAETAAKLTDEIREASASWMTRLVETSLAYGKYPDEIHERIDVLLKLGMEKLKHKEDLRYRDACRDKLPKKPEASG